MSIRVLIADDSPPARDLLAQIFLDAPGLKLVGTATNGLQAVQMVAKHNPTVLVLDAHIPHMDVLETIREIMDKQPIPIVVVDATASGESNVAEEVVKAGALAVLQKPTSNTSSDYRTSATKLVSTVRAMSGVHVIRHPRSANASASQLAPSSATGSASESKHEPEIVSIVASTGGPQTLGEIFKKLPATFKLPIVIVQHITPEFLVSFVGWLNTISPLPVHLAKSGEIPLPGNIYLAPGNAHLKLTCNRSFAMSHTPHNLPHMPSGDILLESVAQYYGSRALGMVLTGMGSDGAQGLRAMYDAGAMTVAQERESCVIFGMPQEAISIGGARQTLTPVEISRLLQQYVL